MIFKKMGISLTEAQSGELSKYSQAAKAMLDPIDLNSVPNLANVPDWIREAVVKENMKKKR